MNAHRFLDRLLARTSLAGIDVLPALAGRLEAYYHLLAHWNSSINLTALPLDPVTDQAIDRLLVEPLVAAHYISMDAPIWFDLGSGGGSPAIPLKLARPDARLMMVESKERKAAFLREAVRTLGLAGAVVEAERIEVVAAKHPLAGSVDLVTVRAVRIDSALFGSVRSMLRVGGRVVLFGTWRSDLAVPEGFEVVERPAVLRDSVTPDIISMQRTAL